MAQKIFGFVNLLSEHIWTKERWKWNCQRFSRWRIWCHKSLPKSYFLLLTQTLHWPSGWVSQTVQIILPGQPKSWHPHQERFGHHHMWKPHTSVLSLHFTMSVLRIHSLTAAIKHFYLLWATVFQLPPVPLWISCEDRHSSSCIKLRALRTENNSCFCSEAKIQEEKTRTWGKSLSLIQSLSFGDLRRYWLSVKHHRQPFPKVCVQHFLYDNSVQFYLYLVCTFVLSQG